MSICVLKYLHIFRSFFLKRSSICERRRMVSFKNTLLKRVSTSLFCASLKETLAFSQRQDKKKRSPSPWRLLWQFLWIRAYMHEDAIGIICALRTSRNLTSTDRELVRRGLINCRADKKNEARRREQTRVDQ